MSIKLRINSLPPENLFSLFLLSADFFQNPPFQKFFQEYDLGPDQPQHSVRPDLGPDCLQKLSADNTRR